MFKVIVIMVGLIVGSAAMASVDIKEDVAKLGTEVLSDVFNQMKKLKLINEACPPNNLLNPCCEAARRFVASNPGALCEAGTHGLMWGKKQFVQLLQKGCSWKPNTIDCKINGASLTDNGV